jgi:hypothetical protein
MDTFLARYQVPNIIQVQINPRNTPITPKEIEAVTNSLPNKKSPGLSTEFYQAFKKT